METLVKIILLIQIVGLFSHVGAIIHGDPTVVNSYPHQVSLRLVENSKHYCGGAILTNRWILTAAQCTQGVKSSIENIFIVVGATNITNGGKRYDLKQIINHPQFDWSKRESDISMLKTANPIAIRDNFAFPIALPSYAIDYQIENGIGLTPVTLTGWGAFEMVDSQEDMELSPILRSQNIYVLSRRSCRRHLGHVNGKLLNEKEICTQNRNGQGMCVGDMGSPLISVNREIVGIASWRGMACGNGFPDVYTRVYSHLNWIWSILIVPDDSP